MTDNPWHNDAERRLREASSDQHKGEGSSSEPRPVPPAEPKAQARLAAAYSEPGRISATRRIRLGMKADALDHPGTAALDELAARVAEEPALWDRLGAQTRIELGYHQAAKAARDELDDDGPSAA